LRAEGQEKGQKVWSLFVKRNFVRTAHEVKTTRSPFVFSSTLPVFRDILRVCGRKNGYTAVRVAWLYGCVECFPFSNRPMSPAVNV